MVSKKSTSAIVSHRPKSGFFAARRVVTEGLIQKLSKVVYEHHGWKLHEVTAAMKNEISKKAKAVESGKVKARRWKGSIDNL